MGAGGGTRGNAVIAARAGDKDAFAALYREHAGTVRAVILRTSGPDALPDLMQETFARALESLASLRDTDRFGPWLTTIARRVAIDHRRRRRPTEELDEDADAVDARLGPEDLAEVGELAALVRGQLVGLRKADAAALAMIAHLGLSVSEVAAAMGLSQGATRVMLHRARRRLRDALVLSVLDGGVGTGCDGFVELHRSGQKAEAARHVTNCEPCRAAARSEVSLFDASLASAPSSA